MSQGQAAGRIITVVAAKDIEIYRINIQAFAAS